MAIPSPSIDIMNNINKLFFQYLLDKKPDKIKRTKCCQPFYNGGLNMIDVKIFIVSLKTTWVKKIVKNSDLPWVKLFGSTILNISKMLDFGPLYCKTQIKSCNNIFWKDTLLSWFEVANSKPIDSCTDLSTIPLWYNNHISQHILYLPTWYSKGIKNVSDVLDENGRLLSSHAILSKFNLESISFLDHYRVHNLVKRFLSVYNFDQFIGTFPNIPFYINILLNSKKGCKTFYTLLTKAAKFSDLRWDTDFSTSIDSKTWERIHTICLKDNAVIWFQLRILNRILGTRKLLFKMHLTDSPLCVFCQEYEESLIHLFASCTKIKQLWNDIQNWINTKLNINLSFNSMDILLGYLLMDQNNIPINTILLTTKRYIFDCSKFKKDLNIFQLQVKLKEVVKEQELISKIEGKEAYFTKIWSTWRNIFSGI